MGELYQSGCVDETTAARLLDRISATLRVAARLGEAGAFDRALSDVEYARIARHIDRCGDCRQFLSALARSKTAERL